MAALPFRAPRPAPAARRPLAPPAAIEAAARVCATCGGQPAGHGFDVLSDRPGRWFCDAHVADGKRRPA